ncbi:hypothetical protein CK820_G0038549 [Pan troglodytes]|uniref:Uncharacterized protein n=1 Tax=Pan troglodytes TaxID=9598 RepID=A0A2J8KIQ9_PANTR|nr:hypothetical protein CK820_G0038549 [Pan troglodytes]
MHDIQSVGKCCWLSIWNIFRVEDFSPPLLISPLGSQLSLEPSGNETINSSSFACREVTLPIQLATEKSRGSDRHCVAAPAKRGDKRLS